MQAETLYDFLGDSLIDHAVFGLSADGIVVTWNAGAQQIFGYTRAEIVGSPLSTFYSLHDMATGLPAQKLAEATAGLRVAHEHWHLRKNGSRFWGLDALKATRDATGRITGFIKLVHNKSEERAAHEALQRSEQQLRLLIESVQEYAIFALDSDGMVTSWNSGAKQLFGYNAAEIVGSSVNTLFRPERSGLQFISDQLRNAARDGVADHQGWLARRDGSQFFATCKFSRIRDEKDFVAGYVFIAHDDTENHLTTVGLQHQTLHDQLTNIPNRSAFHGHVKRAIAYRKRHGGARFAVLFIDLDHFKGINDVFGHGAADTLLQHVSARLTACIRNEDVIARIGGDEFAVLLNTVDTAKDTLDVADRIGAALRLPIFVSGQPLTVTASIGIALCDAGHTQPQEIMHEADVAMYAAKLRGRAGHVVYTPALQSGRKPTLEHDLEDALARDELRVFYQPIVCLSDRKTVGFEALVRWKHPQRGLLEPREFIPIAESTGLILAVDRWVFGKAVKQLRKWQSSSAVCEGLFVGVNFSAKQFSDPRLHLELQRMLDTSDVPPSTIRLEITESALLERSVRTSRLMHDIRAIGIELHVDDFGTGYSSLAGLQRMPVQGVKIDRSFIASMALNSGYEIVRSIATLAANLHLTVIAEGIQTEAQVAHLTEFGCAFGQGYLFSDPLSSRAADAYLQSACG